MRSDKQMEEGQVAKRRWESSLSGRGGGIRGKREKTPKKSQGNFQGTEHESTERVEVDCLRCRGRVANWLINPASKALEFKGPRGGKKRCRLLEPRRNPWTVRSRKLSSRILPVPLWEKREKDGVSKRKRLISKEGAL